MTTSADIEAVQEAEKRMTDHGGVKIVSLWWNDPYVMGVLANGGTIIVSEPTHDVSFPTDDSIVVKDR